MSPTSFLPYRPRRIQFLHLAHRDGWTLKVYGLSHDGRDLEVDQVGAAEDLAFGHLLQPGAPCHAGGIDWMAVPDHGLGVLMVHRGREGWFVLLDTWAGENMLRHLAWVSALASPYRFESIQATGIALCVWELQVLQHEREAWLRHMLTPTGRGQPGAYLDDVLTPPAT